MSERLAGRMLSRAVRSSLHHFLPIYRTEQGMKYDPPDLVEQAALSENWDEGDWRYFHRIEREAMTEAFAVKEIYGNHVGLIAFHSPYQRVTIANFRHVDKPTLRAYEALSRM